jgi:hypothetical protein
MLKHNKIMSLLTDLIGSKTGKSHKRFIALLLSVVVGLWVHRVRLN